jgi:hypothetical protein
VWNDRKDDKNETRNNTQIKIYKVIAVPVPKYGSENWTLIRSERKKTERAEIRIFRPLSGLYLQTE